MANPIQYDERGRPYIQMANGRRSYISPVAMGTGTRPEDQTGIFHQAPQWNQNSGQWETPFDWGNLLNIGVGSALTGGLLDAVGAFGGGAAAAGGGGGMPALSAPASVLPAGWSGMIGAGAAGAGAAGGAAPIVGDTVGGATGTMGSKLLNKGIDTAVGLGVAGLGRALGGGGPQIPPELQQMLDLQKQRMQFQNPLFEAISRLAMSRLPTAQQQPMPGQANDPMAALNRLSNPQGQG